MEVLLVFAITLQIAVLVSDLARRSVLSTAVLFLVAGFLVGSGVFAIIPENPNDPLVALLAELALFSVLFTDGMRIPLSDLVSAWQLPGRALLLGLPLTLLGTAVLGHFIVGLPWGEAALLGAALSPTDPVLAAAIVGREEIPQRLRFLLNVESGVNDGLALPVVLVMIAVLSGERPSELTLAGELALGVALGVAIPWIVVALERTRLFSVAAAYEPLGAFAIGLLVLAVTALTSANEFLAAFAAGITIASIGPDVRDAFQRFGELVTELFKLAALLVFGALISPSFLAAIPWTGYVFALLTLVVVRPFALAIALFGSRISREEWLAAAWFGPKGFASVVFALLIFKSGIPGADELYHLAAIVIVASIIAHSSTDVIVARWFRERQQDADS